MIKIFKKTIVGSQEVFHSLTREFNNLSGWHDVFSEDLYQLTEEWKIHAGENYEWNDTAPAFEYSTIVEK